MVMNVLVKSFIDGPQHDGGSSGTCILEYACTQGSAVLFQPVTQDTLDTYTYMYLRADDSTARVRVRIEVQLHVLYSGAAPRNGGLK